MKSIFLPDISKFWLAFMGDFLFFPSMNVLEDYFHNEWKNAVADYEKSSLKTNPVGFLPMDDEEKEEM